MKEAAAADLVAVVVTVAAAVAAGIAAARAAVEATVVVVEEADIAAAVAEGATDQRIFQLNHFLSENNSKEGMRYCLLFISCCTRL